jgi:hypothetical protein
MNFELIKTFVTYFEVFLNFNNILCLRRISIQRFALKNPAETLNLSKFSPKIFKPLGNLARRRLSA